MMNNLDAADKVLLDGWQRDFPLVSRPFAVIAREAGLPEDAVIDRYLRLVAEGAISRIGATCRPNTAGTSTLAAVAAPEMRVEEVAEVINAEPGVNHSYLRENDWNIWFVATGPDRAHVDDSLRRIGERTGLRVLDLPLVKAFNVDLGFALHGSATAPRTRQAADDSVLGPGDREIMQAMSTGLDLTEKPFAALAMRLGRPETEVIARVRVLAEAGLLSRVGVIVRHRALGWRSNAMVVWQIPEADIERAGSALVAVPGVTLCYQRHPAPGFWPYTLYCMIHARSRREATAVLDQARKDAELSDVPHQVLFSLRCFKQTGALIAPKEAAA